MRPWPPELYKKVAAREGKPPEVVAEALAQARRVQSRGLPAILTLNHLALQCGVPYVILRNIVTRGQSRPYRVFRMRKRKGGYRIICVPNYVLRNTLRWIVRNVLRKLEPHAASGAYTPGSSPIKVAESHCGCRWLIKLDVRRFFESVSEIQVFRVFRSVGYEPLIAFELARLCTRVHNSLKNRRYRLPQWHARARPGSQIFNYSIGGGLGHLPQGAPTSPMLANLAMRAFDAEVERYVISVGLKYSRYADDLIFSTASPAFTRGSVGIVVRKVHELMLKFGLRPHTGKVVVAPPGARKIVLGLLVDRDKPRLRREMKKSLLLELYACEKFGPTAHAAARKWSSVLALRAHLDGLVAYAYAVEPEFADPLKTRLAAAFGDGSE